MKKLILEDAQKQEFSSARALIKAFPPAFRKSKVIPLIKDLVAWGKKFKIPLKWSTYGPHRSVHGLTSYRIIVSIRGLDWKNNIALSFKTGPYNNPNHPGDKWFEPSNFSFEAGSSFPYRDVGPNLGYSYNDQKRFMNAIHQDATLWTKRFGPINVKAIKSGALKSAKLLEKWKAYKVKLNPTLDKLQSLARKLDIRVGEPKLKSGHKHIWWRVEEPRMLRHPDEYGERAEKVLNSKQYVQFEKLQHRLWKKYEAFAKKAGYKFIVAASIN